MASVGQLLSEVKLDDSQVRLQGSTGSIEYQLNHEGDEVGYRDAAAFESITKQRPGMPPLELSAVGDLERMMWIIKKPMRNILPQLVMDWIYALVG